MQNMMQNTSCFQTRDPDQFSEFIHIALPTDIHASPYLRKNFYVNTVSIRLPHTGLFKIRGSNLQAHDSGSRDFVSVTIPLAGEISFLDLPITHKLFLDKLSQLLHASKHAYTKPNQTNTLHIN